eukprot:COSAG04_NODE_13519_length_602_cov_1.318091_1_plen_42_part_01
MDGTRIGFGTELTRRLFQLLGAGAGGVLTLGGGAVPAFATGL